MELPENRFGLKSADRWSMERAKATAKRKTLEEEAEISSRNRPTVRTGTDLTPMVVDGEKESNESNGDALLQPFQIMGIDIPQRSETPGPNEMDDAKKIEATLITNQKKILTIMELAGLIKKASYVIANDTGPAHMAAHLGKNSRSHIPSIS